MTLMEPWLLAARSVCACGFQATAEMNWAPLKCALAARRGEQPLWALPVRGSTQTPAGAHAGGLNP